MKSTCLALALLACLLTAQRGSGQDPTPAPRVATLLIEARAALEASELPKARGAIERALERDDQNLEALLLSAQIAEAMEDPDRAVHDRHRWLELNDSRPKKKQVKKKERKTRLEELLALDAKAEDWKKLVRGYVKDLTKLAKDYEKREDFLGAIDAWSQVLTVSPGDTTAARAITRIRREGGDEVAVEDVFAGAGDPTEGLSEAERKAEDEKHSEWENAWTKETPNYTYRTNAGKLVLETSSIAMEQMNGFYRRFFRFMERGGNTPQIEIRIFKTRDEYLELGSSPVEWSAGQFTGSAVETYAPDVESENGIRSMYGTLFHEAAHQFVRLTGPFVPGWLNEAYASFFEGCSILSNGSVRFNGVPTHRLFPLAQRIDAGWMDSPILDGTESPREAPTFRMIIENRYQWGPPWYAPTWGLVYFLYNVRDDNGRPIYRDALHEYYKSFKPGLDTDPVQRFEDTVLKVRGSLASKVDDLNPIWAEWILALRERELGKGDFVAQLLDWASKAVEREDWPMALEFLIDARDARGDDPDILWQTAQVLEELDEKARAAATYREFVRVMELSGLGDGENADERVETARERIEKLDRLTKRGRKLRREAADAGLALAKDYDARGLPRMALEIARRVSNSFADSAALGFYADLAERTQTSLARWRLAYDERSLKGWTGNPDIFQAYGASIRAVMPGDPTSRDAFDTRELVCDLPFDADFSLEGEVRLGLDTEGKPQGRLAGLCFGRKDPNRYHALLLFPDGYLDLVTNDGGNFSVHDHRNVPAGAGAWHRLRIDVTGRTVDCYLDGLWVRSLDFASESVVRGGFGLLTGPGEAQFRSLRVLARDRLDPAARIEREIALKSVMADAGKRTPGQFQGFPPPDFDVQWHRGEAATLAELRGKPALLVFWSPAAEAVIPCADYIGHLAERGREAGLQTIVICDGGTSSRDLEAVLADHPMTGARIARDRKSTYADYFIKPGFHGMPRFLLLDRAGRVQFEGDPGLRAGEGWKPGDPKTYVDDAFDRVVLNGG
ncbi:MAG: hypothetical protein AAF196_18200 [Planctomycetota bacterium]